MAGSGRFDESNDPRFVKLSLQELRGSTMVPHMSNTFRNAVPTTLGGTLVRIRRYGDAIWTTCLDPATDYKTTVYMMETWEPLATPGKYQQGNTRHTVEVARPAGQKTGWCVRLFGEELPERYDDKGHAQLAAEGLVLA